MRTYGVVFSQRLTQNTFQRHGQKSFYSCNYINNKRDNYCVPRSLRAHHLKQTVKIKTFANAAS